ncbi:hypothetical protein OQA88_2975 [Cercophora sp. LCS_1]
MLFTAYLLFISFPLSLAITLPARFPHLIRQTNNTCTPGASFANLYTFGNLRVNYPASGTGSQSTAAFSITNTRTNQTEALTCNLRIGYQCQFSGTPRNPELQIWLQLNLAAYFSFMDTGFCPGKSISGQAEMRFTCPETPLEQGWVCEGDVESVGVNGRVE